MPRKIEFKILFNRRPDAVFKEIPIVTCDWVPPDCAIFVHGNKHWLLKFGDMTIERFPKFEPLDEDDKECLMTWADFVKGVNSNALTDDDGFGELAIADMKTDIAINPSDVSIKGEPPHEWVTHVCWYNK